MLVNIDLFFSLSYFSSNRFTRHSKRKLSVFRRQVMFCNIVLYKSYHSSINSVNVKLLSVTLVEFAFMLRTGLFTSFTWICA